MANNLWVVFTQIDCLWKKPNSMANSTGPMAPPWQLFAQTSPPFCKQISQGLQGPRGPRRTLPPPCLHPHNDERRHVWNTSPGTSPITKSLITRPRRLHVKPTKATQRVCHESCTQGQEELQNWSSQTEVANKQNWQTQCSLKQNKLSRCQRETFGTDTGNYRHMQFWALPAPVHIIWPLPHPQMSSKGTLHIFDPTQKFWQQSKFQGLIFIHMLRDDPGWAGVLLGIVPFNL